MSLRLEIGGVLKKDDGSGYSVQVKCFRDQDGKLVGDKPIEAATEAELKSKIKPLFEKLVAAEKSRETIRALAQGVIDEIMNEVVQQ